MILVSQGYRGTLTLWSHFYVVPNEQNKLRTKKEIEAETRATDGQLSAGRGEEETG